MEAMDVTSNAALRSYLEASGCEIRSLGSVLGGFEMLYVRAGGKRNPPILITAGAHADELGGVYAALRLIQELESQHRFYILPVRDPFGFEGYRANLRFALGFEAPVETDEDVYRLLREYGEILYEEQSFVVALLGNFAFAYDLGTDYHTSGVARHVEGVVKDNPALAGRLAATERVIVPWNLPMPRFGDRYRQAARGLVVSADGYVGNYNRLFDSADAPREVAYPRQLVDELAPGLVLDLHEGYGSSFWLYQRKTTEGLATRLARAMVMAVQARGARTATPEELQPYWGERLGKDREYLGDGIFYPGSYTTSSFRDYQAPETIAFTLETGGQNPVQWRADMHVWAVRAAVDTWQQGWQYSGGSEHG